MPKENYVEQLQKSTTPILEKIVGGDPVLKKAVALLLVKKLMSKGVPPSRHRRSVLGDELRGHSSKPRQSSDGSAASSCCVEKKVSRIPPAVRYLLAWKMACGQLAVQ